MAAAKVNDALRRARAAIGRAQWSAAAKHYMRAAQRALAAGDYAAAEEYAEHARRCVAHALHVAKPKPH